MDTYSPRGHVSWRTVNSSSTRPPTPPLVDASYGRDNPYAATAPPGQGGGGSPITSPPRQWGATTSVLPHLAVLPTSPVGGGKYFTGSPTGENYSGEDESPRDRSMLSVHELEEKRRKVIREREREQVARLRQRELMASKREVELARRYETEQSQRELEQRKLQELERAREETERRRSENLQLKEFSDAQRAEERRKQAQLEKKREANLRNMELQRLREEERQRITREAILRKRKDMERMRTEAERLYEEKKREEMDRKILLAAEMKQRREHRLAMLEKRRADPVIQQQEREFHQLIEVQASLGRVHTKLDQVLTQREDARERLLEARHLVAMLEAEEQQLSIAVHECESDAKKLEGHEKALSRLVSTRYDDDIYEKSIVKIQALYRGVRGRRRGNDLMMERVLLGRQRAATRIQSLYRGARQRTADQIRRDRVLARARRLDSHLTWMFVVARLVPVMKKKLRQARARVYKASQSPRVSPKGSPKIGGRHSKSPHLPEIEQQTGQAGDRQHNKRKSPLKKSPVAALGSPRKKQLGHLPAPFMPNQRPLGEINSILGGELSRIYQESPRSRAWMVPASQSPRARRFVPTSATAAMASYREQELAFFAEESSEGMPIEPTATGAPRSRLLNLSMEEQQGVSKKLDSSNRKSW